jgi:Secretion system C-terminal sorting domain
MIRILLITVSLFAFLGGSAQYRNNNFLFEKEEKQLQSNNSTNVENTKKTRFVPFYTENCASGTSLSLPLGWTSTAGGGALSSWSWHNFASFGSNSIGAIASPTAANGWMLFDSDSIGNNCICKPQGSLISPSINCSSHATVRLSFYEKFAKFLDSTFVDVSNDGGANWVAYRINYNDKLLTNVPSANPQQIQLNITPTAANQTDVKLRFRYTCDALRGAYNWLIDDITLSELYVVDIKLDEAKVLIKPFNNSNIYNAVAVIPKSMCMPFTPSIEVSNWGSLTQNAIPVKCETFNYFGSLSNSQNQTLALASGQLNITYLMPDMPFLQTPSYYTTIFNSNIPGDVVISDNTDTMKFVIDDSILSHNGYYKVFIGTPQTLFRPAGATAKIHRMIGSVYDTPDAFSDTVTSVNAAFAYGTPVGTKAIVEIHEVLFGTTLTGVYNFRSDTVTLTANDINAQNGSSKLVRFNIPYNNINGTQAILKGGTTYAAVVRVINPSNSGTAALLTSTKLINNQFTMLADDEGPNNYTGNNGLFINNSYVPLVEMAFGHPCLVCGFTDLKDKSNILTSTATPNPANNYLQINSKLAQKAKSITLTIANYTGQLISSFNYYNTDAVNQSIDISSLAKGLYTYTINADGQQITHKFIKN